MANSAHLARSTRAVLKFGGEVAAHPDQLVLVLRDVAQLQERGWHFVLCHGGGPQTSELGRRLGLETRKVAGQRVTDAATLKVACQAIAGEVSTQVVAAACGLGIRAVGLSAGLVHARRRPPAPVASEGGRVVDYGLVGDISSLDLDLIEACWARGLTPVVNPIGVCVDGSPGLLNINADTVAAAIATKLEADHLFAVTSVPGVLRDREDRQSRIPRLDRDAAHRAIAEGIIAGGMIPKVEEALGALSRVKAVHILAAEAGALVGEAAEGGSRGTVFVSGA